MTEREHELTEAASVDDDVLSPEWTGDEPAAEVESATLPLTAPPQPGDADVSPDGAAIAYLQRDRSGTLRLWISPLDGGAPRELATTIDLLESGDAPTWSPDGAWLAVTGQHPADGRSAIFILSAESGAARLLVDHPGVDRLPRWSPDGSMIAFVSRRDGRESVNVAFVDGVGPAVQMTHAPAGQDDHELCWSTDGKRIAFVRRAIENEQVGDHVWTVNVETGETKQVTKRLARRHSLAWAPDRALVLHISDDGEWENVAVVNVDNSAGWNIASEAGDKGDPHYSSDGQRVVYTRVKEGVVRCCERAASSSSAEAVDPGEGVVRSPRFLPDKKVVYLYQPVTGAPRFIVQEPKGDAERTELPVVVDWSSDRALITPYHLEVESEGRKLGGLLYRMGELSGPSPVVLYLADRPDRRRVAAFDPFVQALAASGLTVFAPSLPGTAGYGKKIANALKDRVATEAEVLDLLGVREALKKVEGVDWGRVAVVGSGHGGTLALLLAGSRPGQVQAVVAIDPIADWDTEFDHADAAEREWLARTFGIPATSRGIYAMRTPSTFVGVIDAPVLILGTDRAPAGRALQLDELTADMHELDVSFEHEVSHGESIWDLGLKTAAFLRRSLTAAVSPLDVRAEQVLDAASV
ncbi:MAG: S9 family peptidase [Thermomicrobiales bacterium]|nr:S9 family peptidase [Thermomicrobiales bacterium]